MATTVVLSVPEAVRGSVAFGHTGDPFPTPISESASTAQDYTISFPSSDWVNPGHTIDVTLERSLDGGVTWGFFGGMTGAVSGGAAKGGGPAPTPAFKVVWDGQAMEVRGSLTVNAPFSYGITLTRG